MTEILLTVFIAALIVAAGHLVGGWLAGLLRTMLERAGMDPGVRRIVVGGARPTVLVIAVFAALEYLGLELSGAWGVLGGMTFGIALALYGTLSNIAAGSMLLSLRPYREGDSVTIADHSGTVEEHGLYATTLSQADGGRVVLASNLVLRSPVLNHSRGGTRRVEIGVPVARGLDVASTRAELLAVVAGDSRVVDEPSPGVSVAGIHLDRVDLLVHAWVSHGDFEAARNDLASALATPTKKTRSTKAKAG